jgi:hypothetical protein
LAGFVAAVGLGIPFFFGWISPPDFLLPFDVDAIALGLVSALLVGTSDKLTCVRCAKSALWSVIFVAIGIGAIDWRFALFLALFCWYALPLIFLGALAGFGVRVALTQSLQVRVR